MLHLRFIFVGIKNNVKVKELYRVIMLYKYIYETILAVELRYEARETFGKYFDA